MKTFEELYDLLVDMAKQGYAKLGWDHEQSPMIFLFREPEEVEVYVIPPTGVERVLFMDALADLHLTFAQRGTAALMIEAWARDNVSLEEVRLHEQGMSLQNDPARQEVIMVNIRRGNDQRIGTIKLNREHHRMTAGPLMDPAADKRTRGRFVGPRR